MRYQDQYRNLQQQAGEEYNSKIDLTNNYTIILYKNQYFSKLLQSNIKKGIPIKDFVTIKLKKKV